MDNALAAGVAAVEITPSLPVWLTGFAQRRQRATTIADPLYARAVVLERAGVRLAIVSLDIIQLENALLNTIQSEVQRRTDIPAEHLLLQGTHTHSGPAVFRFNEVMGPFEERLLPDLVGAISEAVFQATRSLEPAALSFAEGEILLGHNRREPVAGGKVRMGSAPDRPYDRSLPVLRLDGLARSAPIAVLFSHALHPVILGAESFAVSADFPGAACRTVRSLVEGAPEALFLQGCCGDVNPPWHERSLRMVEEIGGRLGRKAAALARDARPLAVDCLAGAMTAVSLPLLPAPPAKYYRQEELRHNKAATLAPGPIPAAVARGRARWAAGMAALAETGSLPSRQDVLVQAMRIGEVGFAALQVEPFVETGWAIRRRSPFPRTITLGYSNGCRGYLPTASAYPEGGYEVEDSILYYGKLMFAPEAEGLLVDAAVRLLRALAG